MDLSKIPIGGEIAAHYCLKFFSDESGATAIEYGLTAAGIFACDHRRGEWPGDQSQESVHLDQ
jgi:hypothetical protein